MTKEVTISYNDFQHIYNYLKNMDFDARSSRILTTTQKAFSSCSSRLYQSNLKKYVRYDII